MSSPNVLAVAVVIALLGVPASAAPATLQLLVNGGFEEGSVGWAGWDSSENRGEVVRTTTAPCEGTWAVRMFDSSLRTRSIYQEVGGIVGGQSYVLSALAATKNLGTEQARVVVQWKAGSAVLAQDTLWLGGGTRTCGSIGEVFVAPAQATRARVVLMLGVVTDGQPWNDAEVWYDAVALMPSSTTTAVSSTTTSTTTSTTLPSLQLLVNGGFEEGTVGWAGWDSSENRGEVVRTTTAPCEGAWTVRMFDSSLRMRSIYQEVGGVVGGQSYVLSALAATKNLGTDQARVVLQWKAGSAVLAQDTLSLDGGTRTCGSIGEVFVAPAQATRARVVLMLGVVTDGQPWNDAEVRYDAVGFGPSDAAPPRPRNDFCNPRPEIGLPGATVIGTAPFSETLDTRSAGEDDADPSLSCIGHFGAQKSVWYVYTPPSDGILAITTRGSNYDTAIGVYTGMCVGDPFPLDEVACEGDRCDGMSTPQPSRLSFEATGGVSYFIMVIDETPWNVGGTLQFWLLFNDENECVYTG